ncbi:TIR domain-containing protein [Pseudomonas congelans]|uniref:toll/interleukin-1 receptor domain-containing protein n=1 Tax=Pseudomonas congelans TaxID=200452 RepID=UPI001F36F62D|nr:toll/interleukin-1 receptor domain-containing protein [Pseudomonas congelans]MCF5167560.1 TIR domain-containing protein [Pseudomonas congelans]
MAFFTKSEARAAAKRAMKNRGLGDMITESMESSKRATRFDIFLSHSINDAELVLGTKVLLEDMGKTVYVDWVDDPELDRSQVNKHTAERLRARMKQCDTLLYIATEHASNSKWMPWELGYFDGHKPDKVAILPVLEKENQKFEGQEYLGLYPTVDKDTLGGPPRQSRDPFKELEELRRGLQGGLFLGIGKIFL